jgi:outer membrane immunogenic protein
MKKLVLALALSGMSTAAFAADLPSRSAPPVFVPPPPIFTWTGYYVGVTAGYAFDGDHSFTNYGNTAVPVADIATGVRPGYVRDRASGFTGGGEIGYNYQFMNNSYFGGAGGVVVGIEADAAYVGPGSNSSYIGTTGALSNYHSRTEFVGTVRGRLGYAFNNFLVYGTGGFAYGGVDDNVSYYSPAGVNLFNGNRSSLRTGYAYGGGVAYAIPTTSYLNFFHSSAVTLKAEFIHYDLGTSSILVAGGGGASYTSQIKTQGNLVRAGIDYKFDFSGAPAPILAKY